MKDSLKEYINSNRENFDSLEPGNLWEAIGKSVKHSSTDDLTQESSRAKTNSASLKKIKTMFKYGFGASALVAGTIFLTISQNEKVTAVISVAKAEQKKLPEASYNTSLAVSEVSQREELAKKSSSGSPELNSIEPDKNLIEFKNDSVPEEISNPQHVSVPYFIAKVPKGNDDTVISKSFTLIDTLFNGVKRLEVQVDFCDVNIKPGAGNHVAVHGQMNPDNGSFIILGRKAYKKTESVLKFEKKDSVLYVSMERKKINKRMLARDISSKASIINFEVPPKTEITVNNNSGDVEIREIENKEMSLQTSFGNIKAENLVSNLTLKSSSGNICLINITGSVKSNNSFGNQLLQNVKGAIDVVSSSGDITLKQINGNTKLTSSFGSQICEDLKGDFVSTVASGNIRMKHITGNISASSSFGKQNYEDVKGDLNSSASSGDININLMKGMLNLKTSFGDISGKDVTLIKGGEFKTSSGDIRMSFLNEMKDLSFDLKSSSGKLVIDKNNAKKTAEDKLMAGEGTIQVKGVSSFGDQTYK